MSTCSLNFTDGFFLQVVPFESLSLFLVLSRAGVWSPLLHQGSTYDTSHNKKKQSSYIFLIKGKTSPSTAEWALMDFPEDDIKTAEVSQVQHRSSDHIIFSWAEGRTLESFQTLSPCYTSTVPLLEPNNSGMIQILVHQCKTLCILL